MFVHLRCHSQYSILDGTASPEDLAQKASQEGMKALALTDHGNLFGAIDFYKACKEVKIKAILGCEFYVAPQSRTYKSKIPGLRAAYHLPLLAKKNKAIIIFANSLLLVIWKGFIIIPASILTFSPTILKSLSAWTGVWAVD